MADRGQVTEILGRLRGGDREAFDELLPIIYDELRALATRHLRHERPDHSLQATALTHEAYLRLLGELDSGWQNRAHFFAVAARAIRRILIEHARARGRQKRGGGWKRVTLSSAALGTEGRELDLLALDMALSKLAREDERKARIVELIYFGGLTAEEAGGVLGVSGRTVEREWGYARLWLLKELTGGGLSSVEDAP